MCSYVEANRSRILLRTLLSLYSWYYNSEIVAENGQYIILISITHMNSEIRNIIPSSHNNIAIKINTLGSK
jgi:hypothetical protein